MPTTLPTTLTRVPLERPTLQMLLAEAAALGEAFTEVTAHPADLVADADEMLGAQADLANLEDRGYPVSDGLLASGLERAETPFE